MSGIKSLYAKLVAIMMLLIVSLMVVVGAFLVTAVEQHYLQDFYAQMAEVFGSEALIRDLTTTQEDEENSAEQIWSVLSLYSAELGLDSRSRSCYVLDGLTAEVLSGSSTEEVNLITTPNLSMALTGEAGDRGELSADYMDAAIPITRGEQSYIIYVYDNRQLVENLSSSIFRIIIHAVVIGLVISIALALLLAKTMITPIEKVTDGTKRLAAGDLSRRIVVSSEDEIGVLTENFNTMADHLQESINELENERNKLDTLFLHMTDGVLAFNKSGTLIHANPAASEMLGVRLDANTRYAPLFEDISPLPDLFLLAENEVASGERIIGKRYIEVVIAPFFGAGQGGVLAVLHDVTQTRESEKLQREFVANVSHELRTPLTNVRSYAETLAEDAQIPQQMRQRFLQVILNETDRMTHIVQDLLTLSRYDSGKISMQMERFNLSLVVENLVEALRLDAQKRAHTLRLESPKDVFIVGDKERLMQVIVNVLSNAVKYTPDGGEISVVMRCEGEQVRIVVDDNGIGVPEAARGQIFERFYRVDKARSRESGGTGLGLSIAKEIVERHEGKIELLDKTTQGLRICITLPVEGPAHG